MARITELPNDLTANIDTADALGIVRLLRQSDAQLFAGWGTHPSVNDTTILQKISHLANQAAALMKENEQHGARNLFVFSGCGTSGRMAWMCSRAYNRLLHHLGREPCFRYLIAGGDQSLIISNELPEDDPPQGAEDLKRMTREAHKAMVVYFGITCGLSAPYIAGQIDYALNQPNYTTVLLGFNPVSLARSTPIEKWHKTCKDAFLELERLSKQSDKAVVLNPIIGPEPITGSSRMKGGSMTEILLDTIFITAISSAFDIALLDLVTTNPSAGTTKSGPVSGSPPNLEEGSDFKGSGKSEVMDSLCGGESAAASIIDVFASVYQAAYRPSEGVASLLSLAADCLRHPDGHLYYIGAGTLGILGLIDSSEMVDTYGAALEEVRGFVVDGWEGCHNQEGDLSSKGPLFRNSHTHFDKDILPRLTDHDCIICFCSPEGDNSCLQRIMDRALSTPAKCGLLVLRQSNPSNHHPQLVDKRYQSTVLVELPYYHILQTEPVFAGFALKLIVNAISTGANVLKGRVHGNTMINLTLANDKLYYRSVDIVSELSGVGKEEARTSLLRAIYRENNIDKYASLPVSSHIKVATQQNMVIPLAIILASRCSSVAEAMQVITGAHSLRTIIGLERI